MSDWLEQVSQQLDLTRLAHAYVIEGMGQQKGREVAANLAKALLCKNRSEQSLTPCGHCHSCEVFAAGNHPDFLTLGLEGNSVGVDEVRQVATMLSHTSQMGGAQVVVVNQAHNMTENAANAILKTLEEPSHNSYMFLLVESRAQLMATIRSRCQFISLSTQSREQLKLQYPDVPEYVFGFLNDDVEQIQTLIENNDVEELSQIYVNFIQSLKTGQNHLSTIETASKSEWFESFVVYLMQRRSRQLLLKSNHEGALLAMSTIASYQQNAKSQMGLNKPLALSNLIQKLLPNLR